MVPTMLKRVVISAAIATWMLGVPGCVKHSDYYSKEIELKNEADKLAKAEEKMSELYKDLDAATSEIEKSEQARTDAETKSKKLEQENADLRRRVEMLAQAEPKAAQIQKDSTRPRVRQRDPNTPRPMQRPRARSWNRKMPTGRIGSEKLAEENADLQKRVSEQETPEE